MRRLELNGKRFGRLLVLDFAGTIKNGGEFSKSSRTTWRCLCDCGKVTTVIGRNLVGGTTKSCGCYRDEIIRVLPALTADNRVQTNTLKHRVLALTAQGVPKREHVRVLNRYITEKREVVKAREYLRRHEYIVGDEITTKGRQALARWGELKCD